MRRAIEGNEFAIVTVDITDLSAPQLAGYRKIVKVQGDARDAATIRAVQRHLSARIDLLYVDTKHDFENTMAAYAIYTALLAPRYLVFDDIALNDEMAKFWTVLLTRYGSNAINAVELIPAIRAHPANPGFGVVAVDL